MLACLYCGKTFKHRISEHLQIMHANESEVAKAFAKKGKERKKGILLVKNKGSFRYNTEVLKENRPGLQIIVVRRPNNRLIKNEDFLPCIYCFGFYQKADLWRHSNNCTFKAGKDALPRSSVQAQSRILLNSAVLPDEDKYAGQILLQTLGTVQDEIGKAIVNDKLLIRFGNVLLNKLGIRRKHDISQRLRQLGRLKIQYNHDNEGLNKVDQFYDLLCGQKYDSLIAAVKQLVSLRTNEEGIMVHDRPCLALRLGHNLSKLAQIKYGLALRKDDHAGQTEAESFRKLLSSEWCDEISTVALATIKTNKFNKPEIIPVTSDLVKLKEYLDSQMVKLTAVVSENPTYSEWRNLCEITLARIVLMNKRRSSEASKLLISSYQNRPNWKDTANEEILNSLSAIENKMFDR